MIPPLFRLCIKIELCFKGLILALHPGPFVKLLAAEQVRKTTKQGGFSAEEEEKTA